MARPKKCRRCLKPKRPQGKEFENKEGYCECGRPTKITPEVLLKLEDAFSNALPDREACFYAGIGKTAFYNYQKENPEFAERKESLKLRPNMAARKAIVAALGDVNTAKWWIEKKDPEFRPSTKVEHSGAIEVADLTERMSEEEKSALATLRIARRKRIEVESNKLQ